MARKDATEIRVMELALENGSHALMLTMVPMPPERIAVDVLQAVPIVDEWRQKWGAAFAGVVLNVIVKQPHHKVVRQALEAAYGSEAALQQALVGLKAEVQLRDLGTSVTSTFGLGVSARPWWKLW